MLSRLKFKIEPLVNEMLDQIPQDVLIYGKVLDPAMGGGQFVKEIERRKRAAGLTNDQIKATTFGIERNILCRNYAVNKNKLVGTYDVGNFLEMESSMKFDVIVGNPPYQDSSLPANNALWPRFVNKSFNELLIDGGWLAMITPSSWMNPSGESAKRKAEYNPGLIKKNILSKYNTVVINVSSRIKDHFAVGSTFSYYVVNKKLTNQKTKIITTDGELQINLNDVKFLPAILNKLSLTIVDKFFAEPVIGVTNMKGEGFHSSHSKRVIKNKQAGFDYPLADTSAKYLNGIYLWASEPHPLQYMKKVIINESGYLGPMYDPGLLGTTEHAFVIPVTTEQEGRLIVSQLNSRLFKFILSVCRWGSANHKYVIQNLPKCVGSTDTEIYNHFNLTQEEIDYLESTVK